MSLIKKWKDLLENQSKETVDEFWKEYSDGETKIYSHILEHSSENLSGKIGQLSEDFQVKPVIFMGFLDGINTSLNETLDLDAADENSDINLSIDFEKLYFNMLVADAEYLYNLSQWDSVLTEEVREGILKSYKRSKTVVKEAKIGRNQPCICGSGKKYKHCCGK